MFRSVFLDGKIANPVTGQQLFLRLIGGEANFPFMNSASITLRRGANMNMSITLTPTYAEALQILSKDSPWLRLGNTLGLRWGYADVPGMISDWYYGFMQVPQPSFGEEISITVPATTLAWNANRIERVRVWATEENPLSFREIADTMAQRHGLVVEWGTLSEYITGLIDEKRANYMQGGQTDLQFLVIEGEKLGVRAIVKNDKIYFVDRAAPLPGEPDVNATFQQYGKPDIGNNLFPMTSFDVEDTGTMFIEGHQGLMTYAYGPTDDPEADVVPITSANAEAGDNPAYTAKETNSAPTREGNPANVKDGEGRTLTAKSTIQVETEMGEAGRIFALPLDGSETKQHLQSTIKAYREGRADEQGLTVTWGSLGLPFIIPGMFSRLIGVGDFFDGTYLINEATYEISTGGVDMNCTGLGRGFPAANTDVDAFFNRYATLEEPKIGDPNDILMVAKSLPE